MRARPTATWRKAQRTWRLPERSAPLSSARRQMTAPPLVKSAKGHSRLPGGRVPRREVGPTSARPHPPSTSPLITSSSSLHSPRVPSHSPPRAPSPSPRLSPPGPGRPLLDVLAKPPPSPLAEGACFLYRRGNSQQRKLLDLSPRCSAAGYGGSAPRTRPRGLVGSELCAEAPPRHGR